MLPSARSAEVFLKLRAHPRLDSTEHEWRARPATEFHATADKKHFKLSPRETDGLWPVYKGATFNLWDPDTATYYAWVKPDHVIKVLQDKRIRQQRTSSSPFSEFDEAFIRDPDTLPCLYPRIAFRDVTNRTNQRTVITALVPGGVVLTNKAPYLLWPNGDERDEAFLLGVLSSIPLDWYARRVVEISLNFHIFNGFPIPRVQQGDPARQRVEKLAGRLAAVDDSFKYWAEKVGVAVGAVGTEKENLLAELDAVVAHLYGLDARDLTHIFETFHAGWDHADRLARVLRFHETIETETAAHE